MIVLMIVTVIEDTVLITNLVWLSWGDFFYARARPYWISPPSPKITIEIKLYIVFLQIAPSIEILQFSHTISSG